MKRSPLISVIVPVYKVEDYLLPCIDSILAQTYQNLEIILVDDGSPDNCGKICDEYAKKDKRIVVLHKENGGLSDARNAGLDICKGEYISFVDSDDLIHHQFIEKLYENIITSDADLVYCAVTKFLNKEDIYSAIDTHVHCSNTVVFDKPAIFDELLFEHLSFYEHVVAWNKLYKRKLWDVLRYPKGRIHEDEFVIHHIFDLCEKVIFIDSHLYFYRQRQDSIMFATRTVKQILDKYAAFEDRKDFFKKKHIKHTILNERQKFTLWDTVIIIRRSPLKDIEKFRNILKDDLPVKTKVKLLLKRYTPSFFHFIIRIGNGEPHKNRGNQGSEVIVPNYQNNK